MSPAAALGIGAIRVYQYTLRGFIGPNCRFCPSCSDYAVQALRNHGALRGGAKAGWRILRCNPWNAGGYDPVDPERPPYSDGPVDLAMTDNAQKTATAARIGRD